ncbi:antitoxin AF2212-like protein [Pyrococcus sp. ST04]|uniref:antitoxin AF2212-like protein n=1 Tax=Pyrococcus sp. ST04 TaxID=1183377 RepID=UPI0011D27072|nr:antitoxin AF2212-like protein [Pyrococcus sp. ST04]
MRIRAVYVDGVFKPLDTAELEEGVEVEVVVRDEIKEQKLEGWDEDYYEYLTWAE